MPVDLYAALNLPRDAPKAAVHKAFRTASKRAHPDAGGDRARWALVCLAKDVLTDDARRDTYDRTGKIEEPAPDNTTVQALTLIQVALNKVLEAATKKGWDPVNVDIVADMRGLLQADIEMLETQAPADIKKGLALYAKLRKRFKVKKDKPNHIDKILEAAEIEGHRALKETERRLVIAKLAYNIVNDHTFNWETPTRTNTFNVAVWGTNNSGL